MGRMGKRFFTVKEISEYLGINEKTIYGFVNQRKIPYVKFGRCVRFDLEEINEWVEANAVATYKKY